MAPTVLSTARLPIRPGGVLLVHSSLRALTAIGADADTVIAWLGGLLGTAGTLMMPTLTFRATLAAGNAFDVRTTPSDVGALTEIFRHRPGVVRSLHPTHSAAACGPHTGELLRHHHLDRESCGPNSPFTLLPRLAGQILMLGCPLSSNTTMHAVEAQAPPPFLYAPDRRSYRITDHAGGTTTVEHRYHGFTHNRLRQRYDRLWELLPPEHRWTGSLGTCSWHLMDAQAVFAAGLAALVRDPYAFVEPAPASS